MYCSSCGVAVARGLSFCNHCGARLNDGIAENLTMTSEVKPELLICAMVAVFVLGLAAITALIGVMKAVLDLNAGQILGFTVLSFLIMLLVEGVCIWLLKNRNQGTEKTSLTAPRQEQATKELDAAQARVLPEPVASVTEQTTRPFEPIYSERTSK